MDRRLHFDVYNNSTDDSDFSDYSQNDTFQKRKKKIRKTENIPVVDKSQNVLLKLMNQEVSFTKIIILFNYTFFFLIFKAYWILLKKSFV